MIQSNRITPERIVAMLRSSPSPEVHSLALQRLPGFSTGNIIALLHLFRGSALPPKFGQELTSALSDELISASSSQLAVLPLLAQRLNLSMTVCQSISDRDLVTFASQSCPSDALREVALARKDRLSLKQKVLLGFYFEIPEFLEVSGVPVHLLPKMIKGLALTDKSSEQQEQLIHRLLESQNGWSDETAREAAQALSMAGQFHRFPTDLFKDFESAKDYWDDQHLIEIGLKPKSPVRFNFGLSAEEQRQVSSVGKRVGAQRLGLVDGYIVDLLLDRVAVDVIGERGLKAEDKCAALIKRLHLQRVGVDYNIARDLSAVFA